MLALSLLAALIGAPEPWAVRLEIGQVGVEQAYGGRPRSWLFSAGVEHRMGSSWSWTAGLDTMGSSDEAGELSASNRAVALTGGAALFYETDVVRLDGRAVLGPALQRSSLRDGAGWESTAMRVRPVADASAGMALRVLPDVALGLRPGFRWEPGRLHIYVVGALAWALDQVEHRP